MAATVGKTLQFITSVTFGVPDLHTVYIGSLGMSRLPWCSTQYFLKSTF